MSQNSRIKGRIHFLPLVQYLFKLHDKRGYTYLFVLHAHGYVSGSSCHAIWTFAELKVKSEFCLLLRTFETHCV